MRQPLFKVFKPVDFYTPQKLPTGPGRTFRLFNDILRIRDSSDESLGHLLIVEVLSPAGGGAPPIHTHPMQEIFYILEGKLDLDFLGESGKVESIHLGKGDCAQIPYQMAHTYANRSDATCHFLATYTPPGGIGQFFRRAATPVDEFALQPNKVPTEDEIKRIVEIAEQCGIQFIKLPN